MPFAQAGGVGNQDYPLDFSTPGKPRNNAMVESFNGRLGQECLNENWLMLQDAKHKIAAWRGFYNEERPHSALDWQTPKEFALLNGSKPCLQNNKESDLLTSKWYGVISPLERLALEVEFFSNLRGSS